MRSASIRPAGDAAFLICLGAQIEPDLNEEVLQLAYRLRLLLRDVPDLEVVPAYASILVSGRPGALTAEKLDTALHSPAPGGPRNRLHSGRTYLLPVAYGGEYGPDLEDLALLLGLTAEAVIERHSSGCYRIYCLGFSPGFPYLGGLDRALAAPRLPSPRPRVPDGSVGIGGEQTGVYPTATPGGWRLIGRTPLRLFDVHRDPPVDYGPGDTLRFLPVSAEEYRRLLSLSLSPEEYLRTAEGER